MKRFLILSFFLWASLFLWSSTASAVVYVDTKAEAYNGAMAAAASHPDRSCCTKLYYNYEYDTIYAYTTDNPDQRFSAHRYPRDSGACEGYFYQNSSGTYVCSDTPEETPQSCDENGQYWQESTGSCVASCPDGSLDHFCLEQAPIGEPDTDENGDECTPSSPDYQGIAEGKHYCDSNLPEPATCPEGQMSVIQLDDSGAGAFACGEPITDPDGASESETETTETTTDAEGNTTTTTTDDEGNTTTTTSDGEGNSTTINNYPGTDSETGGPCTADSVACKPTAETEKGFCKDGGSLCDDVNDIKESLDQESDRETKSGEFDDEGANTAVETAESELTAGLDSIKAEIGTYFDLSLTAGDMVCGPGVDVLGTTIQICPSEMKDELAVIAQIVLLMAGLISLMIIFR